jgi:hypothetical protein
MPLRIVNPGEMTDKGGNIKRRRRLTEEEKEKAIKWRREDLTYEKIGVLLGGVPPSTLERYLKGVKPEKRVRPSGSPPRQVGPSPATQRPALSLIDQYLVLTRLNERDYDSPEAILKDVEEVMGPTPEGSRSMCKLICEEIWKMKKEAKERREREQELAKKFLAGIESAQGLMPLQTLVSTMSDSITNLSMLVTQLHDKVDHLDTALFQLQQSVNLFAARAR